MLKREFSKSYVERFGEDWVNELLNKISLPYQQYMRVNTLKIKTSDLLKRLSDKGFRFEKIDDISYAFKLVNEPFRISSTDEYLLGYLYLQDKASMYPVIELNPLSSDKVLDASSAPGGKTSHLAQLMNNKGLIVGVDNKIDRLNAQLFNLQRLGVKNTATFNYDILKIKKLGLVFDKVLLDAPCSATGTMWREKKRMKSVNKHEVKKHSELQKRMLKSCADVLKNGGSMVYSTCSIEDEENEDNIVFAENVLNLKVLKTKYFFPHINNTIGFFYAVMQK